MNSLRLPVILLLFVSMSAHAGSPLDDVRAKVKQAQSNVSAASVRELCGYLLVVTSKVATLGKNVAVEREWEDVQWDIQMALAAQNTPDCVKTMVQMLSTMAGPPQVTLLLALKQQPANPDVDRAAHQVLKSSGHLQVQVAAMDLLGTHRVVESVPSILRLLSPSQSVMVQIAACRALAQIPSKDSPAPLIEFLSKHKSGRMRYEAIAALRALSGRSFGVDVATWRNWWDSNKAVFVPPAEPNPVFNYELQASPNDEPSYYEIPVVESRVLFVLDMSGSMKLGGSPNRWERARDELKRLIERLDEKVSFNIILFSTKVKVWQEYPPLVPANAAAKAGAKTFLDKADPNGTTATTDALETALRQIALSNGVETVYLLSDGAPMPMQFSQVRTMDEYPKGLTDIQERIRLINQSLKVRLHTIGIYTKSAGAAMANGEPSDKLMRDFLENMAKENDGVYREVK